MSVYREGKKELFLSYVIPSLFSFLALTLSFSLAATFETFVGKRSKVPTTRAAAKKGGLSHLKRGRISWNVFILVYY